MSTSPASAPASLPLAARHPERCWPEDIRLMAEAALSGMYKYMAEIDWLGRAISALADAGIASVVGTPTTSPVWLVQQYPDTLAVDESSRRMEHGWLYGYPAIMVHSYGQGGACFVGRLSLRGLTTIASGSHLGVRWSSAAEGDTCRGGGPQASERQR